MNSPDCYVQVREKKTRHIRDGLVEGIKERSNNTAATRLSEKIQQNGCLYLSRIGTGERGGPIREGY